MTGGQRRTVRGGRAGPQRWEQYNTFGCGFFFFFLVVLFYPTGAENTHGGCEFCVCVCMFVHMQGEWQQNGTMWSFTCCLVGLCVCVHLLLVCVCLCVCVSMCVYVYELTCIFSLAMRTWQALEQRTDSNIYSFSWFVIQLNVTSLIYLFFFPFVLFFAPVSHRI